MNPSSANQPVVLRHGRGVLILGIIAVGFFFGLAILSNTWGKNATTSIWSTLLFVGFGSLGLPLIADYRFARHRGTGQGLDYGSMCGRRGFIAWPDVRRITLAPNMGWLVIHSQSGAKARLSVMMSGWREFSHQILEHVSREKIDREALIFLMHAESDALGVFVDPDSEEWRQALRKTQQSIPVLRKLQSEVTVPVLVKYAVSSSTGEIEHVWGELERIDDSHFRATLETPMLSGDPGSAPPFDLPLSALEDWVVTLPDGSIRGGFTAQAEILWAKRRGDPIPQHIAAMDGRFRDPL
jgi:hypothetical protein